MLVKYFQTALLVSGSPLISTLPPTELAEELVGEEVLEADVLLIKLFTSTAFPVNNEVAKAVVAFSKKSRNEKSLESSTTPSGDELVKFAVALAVDAPSANALPERPLPPLNIHP